MNKYEFQNPTSKSMRKGVNATQQSTRNKCIEAFIQKQVNPKPQIPTLVAGHPMLGHLQGRQWKNRV